MTTTEPTSCRSPCAGDGADLFTRLLLADGKRPAPAPDLPSGQDMRRYLVAALAAAVPCLCAASHYFGGRVWLMLTVAFLSQTLVELVVSRLRRKPVSGGTFVYATLLVLILPPSMPLWMVAIGAAFGTLFGKEAFGGTGTHVFCPVLVAKGFLLFSYPTDAQGPYFGNMIGLDSPNAWLVAGALTLIAVLTMAVARPGNLNILAGIFLGAVCVGLMMEQGAYLPRETVVEVLGNDGMLFGACFLATDPACSPRDSQAKWFYGLLIGSAAILMRCFSTYSEAMMCAVLVGNLFAPSLDMMGSVPLGRRGAS